jgi:hypothetical protein
LRARIPRAQEGIVDMRLKASLLGILLLNGAAASAEPDSQAMAGGAAQAPAPVQGPTTAAERDPEAIAALERMGAFLRTLTTFEVVGEGSTEEELTNGQTIQYPGTVEMLVTRPNRLRGHLYSTRKRREYFYDGTTFTVFAPRMGFYAQVAAPPTIIELARTASERLDMALPMADLFSLGADPALTARITSAMFVGTDVIGDEVCNHFAFRQPNVDWQIWIRDGAQPLPCKWVITGTDHPTRLDYEMIFTWDLNPTVPANAFTFVPPEGADRISLAATKQ